jgi:hypothetical protein
MRASLKAIRPALMRRMHDPIRIVWPFNTEFPTAPSHVRPHSRLRMLTPAEFGKSCGFAAMTIEARFQ